MISTDRHRSRRVLLLAGLLALPDPAAAGTAAVVHVTIDSAGQGALFDPQTALGAGIDGAGSGETDRLLTPGNVVAMRSAGLPSLTYRLRSELGVETWHWNPVGQWSDPARQQGYWVSSPELGAPIATSFGYRLPRRGDTIDNANDDDFSRLTDGDEASFWKSNPYLDRAFLKRRGPPQWAVVRLDRMRPVNAIRIVWGDPYALRYRVEYWSAPGEYDHGGHWIGFPHGQVVAGRGGVRVLRLAARPVMARFVRIVLEQGSQTAPAEAQDWRDRAGFAIREIGLGTIGRDGQLVDHVVHAADHARQTFTHVSSTDPWHRASDRDPKLEQPGIDRVMASGLTNGLPLLLPTGLLFDVPENAAAELRYVAKRGYRVRQIELGEEPDGQYGNPEDYAALYLAWVDRLRGIIPGAVFGGPSAQDAGTGTWMNDDPDRSWNSHFIRALKARHRLGDLGFYSFEYYPFDDLCGDIPAKLVAQDRQLHGLMLRLAQEGVPRTIPWIISEYGFSAYAGRAMAELPSALLMAGIVGQFLEEGGATAYLYGYGPNLPINQHLPCAGYGNMMLHMADKSGQATTPMPTYAAARLIAGAWLQSSGAHRFLPSAVTGATDDAVRSFAVRRPDGRIGLLLVNRSATTAYRVDPGLTGPAQISQYGPEQYLWADEGAASHPSRSEPPVVTTVPEGAMALTLPPQSLAVVVRSRP